MPVIGTRQSPIRLVQAEALALAEPRGGTDTLNEVVRVAFGD